MLPLAVSEYSLAVGGPYVTHLIHKGESSSAGGEKRPAVVWSR
jgi:hypothetical protein